MSKLSPAPRLIGNCVAALAVLLLGAWLFDLAAISLDYEPWLFCSALVPLTYLAQGLGLLLCTIGLVMWAVSFFRSDFGAGLALGGFLLGLVPIVLPHLLGAWCVVTG